MTAYKDLRRHPAAPMQRSGNRMPSRFVADAWPGSAVRAGGKPAKPLHRR